MRRDAYTPATPGAFNRPICPNSGADPDRALAESSVTVCGKRCNQQIMLEKKFPDKTAVLNPRPGRLRTVRENNARRLRRAFLFPDGKDPKSCATRTAPTAPIASTASPPGHRNRKICPNRSPRCPKTDNHCTLRAQLHESNGHRRFYFAQYALGGRCR
jgi:hypothetical protein